jgi:hypothetical protein
LEIDHHAVGLSADEVVDVDSDPGHWANLLAITARVLTRNGGNVVPAVGRAKRSVRSPPVLDRRLLGKIFHADGTHRRKTDYQ